MTEPESISENQSSSAADDVCKSLPELSSATADDNNSSLHLKQKQNDFTKKSAQVLEATIADPGTSLIDKTRARLELALLQGDDNRNEQPRIKKEIDAMKEAAGVAKAKDKLEQGILTNEEMHQRENDIRNHQEDLAKEAQQRRIDAKRRAEDQRRKAADAQNLLAKLEKEAEDAIMKAKEAMKRANDAWVEAGREQKKALELEAQLEVLQLIEVDSTTNEVEMKSSEDPQSSSESTVSHLENGRIDDQLKHDKVDALVNDDLKDDATYQRSASEGYFTKYFKLSIKVEELQKDRDELDARLKENETTMERLRDRDLLHDEKIALLNKLHDETILSLNKLHEQKIMSLNEYIKDTGQSQLFWKHQSKVLAEKLKMSRQRKSEQEKEVIIIKDQLDIRLKEIEELNAEIQDLRETKDQFEAQLSAVDDRKKCEMLKLKEDADALLTEKEHALYALQIVQDSHLKFLDHHKEEVDALGNNILVYNKDFEDAKEKERDVKDADATKQEDELKQLSDECRHWKKKASNLITSLDILKDEIKAQQRENAKLKQSIEQDRLFSKLRSDYKQLKKKSKDLQLNLRVTKKEVKDRDSKVRERDAKIKEQDAIIDELSKRALSTETVPLQECSDAGQKSAVYWKYEAGKLQEKLTKLERHSRVRDAMMEISSEISGFKQHQRAKVQDAPLECVSVSFELDEINATKTHDDDEIISPECNIVD